MRMLRAFLCVLFVLAFCAGCSDEGRLAPEGDQSSNDAVFSVDPDAIAAEIAAQSGWAIVPDEELPAKFQDLDRAAAATKLLAVNREVIVGDIAHYSFKVRVGFGRYDVIGLHRVVKESKPYCPIKTKENIFLQHGDAVGFVKFLFGAASPSTPDDQAFAVFLAQNGVDVWGIDQAWILVPMETADFSFMADWGMQRQINDLRIGLAVARATRLLTGSGYGQMNLLGYSSGVLTGYAYLNAETQMPGASRNVGGYIPADAPYKWGTAEGRQASCDVAASFKAIIDAGTYQDEAGGILFITLGELARTDPDGESPIIPGVTNLQAVLFLGTSTYMFWPVLPAWHYWGGVFDEFGLPTGLQYTTLDGMLDFLASAAPWEPVKFEYDYSCIWCDEVDVPFDDHLAEIAIPVFYVGAAGGFGESGIYTTTLLGSADVSSLIVRLHPDEEIGLDFGHIDLWTAGNAEAVAWTPILGWIEAHTE